MYLIIRERGVVTIQLSNKFVLNMFVAFQLSNQFMLNMFYFLAFFEFMLVIIIIIAYSGKSYELSKTPNRNIFIVDILRIIL